MPNLESTPTIDPIKNAKERYDSAVRALADAGAMNFVELVEARNPVAMEYLLALEEYSEVMGTGELVTEK